MTPLTNESTLEHPQVSTVESASNAKAWRRPIPFSMPREQVYYWSHTWQIAEADARAAHDAGRFCEFDSTDPRDIVRWLHEPDDED